MLSNKWIVFGGIAVVAFFTVFGSCLNTRTSNPAADNALEFQTATPIATASSTASASATPATVTATPVVRRFGTPPALAVEVGKRYIATITTDKGRIRVELNAAEAPQGVNAFRFLAGNKYYDGLSFQRVTGFVAQGGDGGTGAPGFNVPVEPNNLSHDVGTVALARSSSDNAFSGQFYIVKSRLAAQDGKDTVIGRVIDGMDVVSQLTPADPTNPSMRGDKILSVTVEEAPSS